MDARALRREEDGSWFHIFVYDTWHALNFLSFSPFLVISLDYPTTLLKTILFLLVTKSSRCQLGWPNSSQI